VGEELGEGAGLFVVGGAVVLGAVEVGLLDEAGAVVAGGVVDGGSEVVGVDDGATFVPWVIC